MAAHDAHVESVERHFDALSHEYDSYASRRGAYVERVDDLIAERIEALDPCTYLDVGCGTGRLLRKLRERAPGSRGLGVDVSSKMVERCRADGLEVSKLDFIACRPDPPVDVLILEFNVFGYLVVQNGLEATLDHMRTIVASQGQILFDILNPYCVTHASLAKTLPEALRRWLRLARSGGMLTFDYAVHGQRISMGMVEERLVVEWFVARGFEVEVLRVGYDDGWVSRALPDRLSSQVLLRIRPE